MRLFRAVATVVVVAWAGVCAAQTVEADAQRMLRQIQLQAANEAVEHYELAVKAGRGEDACFRAGIAAQSFLQAQDAAQYRRWKDVEQSVCRQAALDTYGWDILLAFALSAFVGWLIGRRRGRPLGGVLWSIFGPIGWLIVALLPRANATKSTACPHCGGVLPLLQVQCGHCTNRVSWIKGRAVKPSRAA